MANETEKRSGKSAEEMAKGQREIGVAEFFAKNKHLLGFDNKRKALLTTIKEAVDNSLDACEEAGILPEISVEIIEMGNDRYRVIIEDNGPGIVKEQIPKIFAKLLYGSKFHSLRQNRGQQGIGISASVMYGQLTTGRASKIISKTAPDAPGHQFDLKINTSKNEPEIVDSIVKEWTKDHGTKIQIDLEASYQKGNQSVDEYLKETAVVNPHVTIIYTNPKAEQIIFPRATDIAPKPAEAIKPHPYGVELGVFLKMLEMSKENTITQFLTNEFSKISNSIAKSVLEDARVLPKTKPKKIKHEDAEKILKSLKEAKIQSPSADCISPITSELLERGIKKEVNAEFYTSITRPPAVYKGYPFQIECCTGDSKLILEDGTITNIKNYVESEDSRNVLSMNDDLKIVSTKIVAKQKFKNIHKLLKIKTKTGRELTLTENNEVPVIENGKINWVQAQNVAVGQYLTVPKKYIVKGKIPRIIDLLESKFVQVIDKKLILYLTDKLILKYDKLKNSVTDLGIKYDRLKSFRKNTSSSKPYLNEIEKICFVLNENYDEIKNEIKEIRFVDNNFLNPSKIKVPEINEDLLYVLGLLDSDGYINHKSIQFVNLDETLHESYKSKFEYLFNIKIKKYKNNSNCCSKTIYNILMSVKKIINQLPSTLVIAYLKGIVDGDGWINVDKKEIGIATAKRENAEFIQTLLLRIGIISKIEIKKIPLKNGFIKGREIKTRFEQHNLIINGHSNLICFKENISFRQKKRLERIEKIDLNYEFRNSGDVFPLGESLKQFRTDNDLYQYQLGFSDQSIRQVEKGNQNITRDSLIQILIQKEFVGETYQQLLKLIQSDILCDKIVDIKLMPNEEFVYDLTTENGNFIANNIVMHNCALAYGGEQPSDKSANIMRFANRVPLLFQQGGCAVTKGIQSLSWKPYGLNQPNGSLPVGPLTIVVHIASVWVPFTSESKEAIASYPEILKEIKLALQEAGRNLSKYTAKKKRVKDELKKRSYIEKYIPHVATGLKEILGLDGADEEIIIRNLKEILEQKRGTIDNMEFDPTKNTEYDKDWASIGKDKKKSDDNDEDDDENKEKDEYGDEE